MVVILTRKEPTSPEGSLSMTLVVTTLDDVILRLLIMDGWHVQVGYSAGKPTED